MKHRLHMTSLAHVCKMDNFLTQPRLSEKYSGPLGRASALKVRMNLSAQFNTGEGERGGGGRRFYFLCNHMPLSMK